MKRVILVISSVLAFGFWSEVFAESFGCPKPYSSHKIYGDYAYSVQRTSDVGYIVVGETIKLSTTGLV
jgi:hypothetical protein